MERVSTFEALVREVSSAMTGPTFQSFLIMLGGRVFAHPRTVIGIFQDGHPHPSFPHRPWYRLKRRAPFADLLTALRRQSLPQRFWETPARGEGPRKSLQSLLDLCSRAA